MNVIVATHEPPFALDRPFRWREPRPSDTAAKSGDQMCFSTECTLGFAAGDTNLYRYCGNSPTNATDPSGHVANVVAGAGIGAIFGAGAYLYQYATGGIEEFSLWDMGAYTLGGAHPGRCCGWRRCRFDVRCKPYICWRAWFRNQFCWHCRYNSGSWRHDRCCSRCDWRLGNRSWQHDG